MSIRRIFFILNMLIILISSCCDEKDSSSGSISSDVEIKNYQHWENYNCYKFNDCLSVLDDSTFKSIFRKDSSNNDCKDLELPTIDFSKFSLLVYKKFDNSRLYYHRSVYIDHQNKVVTYSISTTNCFCADVCESSSLNMVLIPKIDSTYKVVFN